MQEYKDAARAAMRELLGVARCRPGDVVVVGCSTSEVAGSRIGTAPGPDIAAALLEGLLPPLREAGLFLAAQCCEHLGRALVVEAAAAQAHGLVQVNAVPVPKAGGSFATAAYAAFAAGGTGPMLVEHVRAAAGMDIGHTLIGMHLGEVAVPVRLQTAHIGQAPVVAARTRPKFVGGQRAVYDPELL